MTNFRKPVETDRAAGHMMRPPRLFGWEWSDQVDAWSRTAGLRCVVIVAFALLTTSCRPVERSADIGIERRGGVDYLVMPLCEGLRVTRIEVGASADLDGEVAVDLDVDLGGEDAIAEYRLNGLVPPTGEPDALPNYPLHGWITFDGDGGGVAAFAFDETPSDGMVVFTPEGGTRSVETTRDDFIATAADLCSR